MVQAGEAQLLKTGVKWRTVEGERGLPRNSGGRGVQEPTSLLQTTDLPMRNPQAGHAIIRKNFSHSPAAYLQPKTIMLWGVDKKTDLLTRTLLPI